MKALHVVCALALAWSCISADAKTNRSHQAKAEFRKSNLCPSTNSRKAGCPGYVIDHIIPLCAGGVDHPSNMQWQTVPEAKIKDRQEQLQCAAIHRK
jgi:hypothetical protein